MDTPIVIELQRLASAGDSSVTELLRKALIVASKLKIADFKTWIENELKGYANNPDVPAYRHVYGEIKAFNPVNRVYMPVIHQDPAEARGYAGVKISNPIAELEHVLQKEGSGGHFVVDFSPEQRRELLSGMDDLAQQFVPRRHIAKNQIVGIVAHVRDTILRWSLQLEEEGILGEGMTFTDAEKKKAAESTTVHIQNFYGVWGDVTGRNVQVGHGANITEKRGQA